MSDVAGIVNDSRVWAATIGAAIAVGTFVANVTISMRQTRVARRREAFADAYRSVVAYAEYPYVVRRRDRTSKAAERLRISSELRRVQEEMAYHVAWVQTESGHVARAYRRLVAEVRSVAGTQIHDAWLRSGAVADADMNIQDVDLRPLGPHRDAYLEATKDVLSLWPWWLRVTLRSAWRGARRRFNHLTNGSNDSQTSAESGAVEESGPGAGETSRPPTRV